MLHDILTQKQIDEMFLNQYNSNEKKYTKELAFINNFSYENFYNQFPEKSLYEIYGNISLPPLNTILKEYKEDS